VKRNLLLLILGYFLVVAGLPTSVHATRSDASLTDPQGLALPASAWPADTVMEEAQVINAADADTGFLLPSATVSRTLTYAAAGMTSGYYQRYAHRSPGAGNVLVYWMPTLYGTSSQADTMVALGKQAIAHHATPAVSQACPDGMPANCTVFITTSVSNSIRIGYAVWSMDNVLAEASLVAYAGTSAFPLDVFQAEQTTLVQAAYTTMNAALHPAPTATDTPVSTDTPQPARATPVPTSTKTSVPTATATAIPSPTPTATVIPLFVSVRVQHRSLTVGSQQTIRVSTLPRATLAMVVTFPDGVTKRHQGTAGLQGTAAWSFRQPSGHTTASSHTARVVVTARTQSHLSAKSSTRYTIR
jgi:hypothetical protein